MSQSAKKAEEQKKSQEQGRGWNWKGQGLPTKAVPDPLLVGGNLLKDGRGLVLMAALAPAHHSHQVPDAAV